MTASKWQTPPDARFIESEYICRPCTHDEKHNLWYRWHYIHGIPWDDEGAGYMHKIGELAGRPIVVTVWWADIQMKRVAFVDPHSQLVDYKLVEEWCSDVFPNARHYANPTNFHNILGPIQKAAGGMRQRDYHELEAAINAVKVKWVK